MVDKIPSFFNLIYENTFFRVKDLNVLFNFSVRLHAFYFFQLYQEIFEKPFLQASGEHYKREASRLLQECDVSQYMERVTQKLEEETLRSHKFVHYR